jgi:hypothetical protein
MRTTARFSVIRKRDLSNLFTTQNLSTIWRDIVRTQMRSLSIVDLHDYHDFSANIKERAEVIRNRILKAQYKASSPLIYRIEKRYGVCRHIMIPAPSDALVFQTITEYLAPLLKKTQPTEKAYYSRDKHVLKLPHQFQQTRYPWFILWPKYQKEIWKFTDDCDYLVVTDITDFFDNIGLRELRHIISSTISSKVPVKEVILDLLFNIIEQLMWVPDYLPTSFKGLPTINIEAFRLLPHIMLFEVDQVLDKRAHGNFVRWMDDINIGVSSKDEAHSLLGTINEVLKSRGLALNLSKTDIYSAAEAKAHFMFDENTYLDQAKKMDPSAPDFPSKKAEFIAHFRSHLKKSNLKHWDKVTKRYFNIARLHKITGLLRYTYNLFLDNPSIRDSIILYLRDLGFSKRRAKIIINLLNDVKRYDDVTLYDFCRLATDMEIPRTKTGNEFINAVNGVLATAKSDFDLYCHIWFMTKYGEPHKLMSLIVNTIERWRNEQFLARQVVSVLPRLLRFNEEYVMRLLNEQMTAGPRDAASVATNIHSLLEIERLSDHSKYLSQYLFPPKRQRPYPLPKYLILTSALSSQSLKLAEKRRISGKVKEYITDPWYLYWLKKSALVV